MERRKTPTWVWVVVGIIGFCVLALVVVVGGGIYMFRQHVQTESASTQDVQQEFEQARQRFAGQQPLVEIPKSDSDDRQVLVHKPLETAKPQTNLRSIRVLAYDPREGRLVRVDVRCGSRGWQCPVAEERVAARSRSTGRTSSSMPAT